MSPSSAAVSNRSAVGGSKDSNRLIGEHIFPRVIAVQKISSRKFPVSAFQTNYYKYCQYIKVKNSFPHFPKFGMKRLQFFFFPVEKNDRFVSWRRGGWWVRTWWCGSFLVYKKYIFLVIVLL